MSGIRVLQQSADGLDTLKELLAIIKNPSILEEASKAAQKELSLSEAEKKKLDDAKAFISDYEKKASELESSKTDISKREDKLQASARAHADNVQIAEDKLAKQAKALNDAENILSSNQAAHLQEKEDHKESLKEFSRTQAAFLAERNKFIQSQSATMTDLEKKTTELKAKQERLDIFEKELKAKAAKLQAAAASL